DTPGANGQPLNFRAPHWLDVNGNARFEANVAGERAFPFIYVRNSTLKVSARFTAFNVGARFVTVRGTVLSGGVPTGATIPPSKAFRSITGVECVLPFTLASAPFGDWVDKHVLGIKWEFFD